MRLCGQGRGWAKAVRRPGAVVGGAGTGWKGSGTTSKNMPSRLSEDLVPLRHKILQTYCKNNSVPERDSHEAGPAGWQSCLHFAGVAVAAVSVSSHTRPSSGSGAKPSSRIWFCRGFGETGFEYSLWVLFLVRNIWIWIWT